MKTLRTLADFRAIPSGQDRTVEFIISSERKDRHGTVLDINGWVLDNYNKNPIVGYQHDIYGDSMSSPNPDCIIGTAQVYREGGYLIGAVCFEPESINPLSEKIYQKVLHGTLRAASVGFICLEKPAGRYGRGKEAQGGKNETYYYGRRELIEFSIVNIGSNQDAVRRAFEQRQLKELKVINPQLVALDIGMHLAGIDLKAAKREAQAKYVEIGMALAGVDLTNTKRK